jgi:hypothetical protein
VQRVEFGKRLLVGQGVAAGKGPGRWTAPVAQVVLGRKLLDEPLHLRARVAGDLDQEAQQRLAFLARALDVPKLAQHPLDPVASRGCIGGAEVDVGGAIEKALDPLKAE